MTQSSRRRFLKNSTIGAAVASTNAFSQTASLSNKSLADAAAIEAKKDLATTANWNDGLVHPAPYQNPPGKGKERGLALGGGGMPLIAWYAGYAHALKQNGIDLSNTDVAVGTSAGSMFGAMLTGGRLWRLVDEIDFFSDFPKILAEIMPAVQFNNSQKRALQASLEATDASPATIQNIGKAAMASLNPDGVAKYYKVAEKLLGTSKWPSAAMHVVSIDCYTGERVVASSTSGVPINVACAASSSVPGQLGPTFVKERLCMDGGVSQSSTHADVIAGVKRAIVISLGDGTPNDQKRGLRISSLPNTLNQEIKDLEAAGTKVKLVVVGLPPGLTKVENLIDPKWIAPYLKYGRERGLADVAAMKAFWS